MIICPWCGQQTKSDAICDWCKRPLDRKVGPPPGTRNDLDFLKDESEVDRYGMLKIGARAACAVAIGAALYFVFFHPSSDAVAQTAAAQEPPAQVSSVTVPPARLVGQAQYQDHSEEFWINDYDTSNARGGRNWMSAQPPAQGHANVPVNFPQNSPVKLQNVEMTMISLPGNKKRIAGRADIVNGSDKNVIDYRVELVWAANDYSMLPLQGTQQSLHQVYQRALRPGKKMAIQLVSTKIANGPEGTPNAVRLTAWLDGNPGTALDEYQLQFTH
jgi:hypothetical protein